MQAFIEAHERRKLYNQHSIGYCLYWLPSPVTRLFVYQGIDCFLHQGIGPETCGSRNSCQWCGSRSGLDPTSTRISACVRGRVLGVGRADEKSRTALRVSTFLCLPGIQSVLVLHDRPSSSSQWYSKTLINHLNI